MLLVSALLSKLRVICIRCMYYYRVVIAILAIVESSEAPVASLVPFFIFISRKSVERLFTCCVMEVDVNFVQT